MKSGVRSPSLGRGLLRTAVMAVARGANTPEGAKRWLFKPKFGDVVALSVGDIALMTGVSVSLVRSRVIRLQDGEVLREKDLPPPRIRSARLARSGAWTTSTMACAAMRLPFERFGELVR